MVPREQLTKANIQDSDYPRCPNEEWTLTKQGETHFFK